MARRRAKKLHQEDASILPEAPKSNTRSNSLSSPALLFITAVTVWASVVVWLCVQHRLSLDQVSETFATIQQRLSNFQQVMEMTDAQTDTGLFLEERILGLEEAQKQAQEKAKVALDTSEKLKNSDIFLQLRSLNTEINSRWDEVKQFTLSVTTLRAMLKNQSEGFDVMKQVIAANFSSSSALSDSVAALAGAVAGVCLRVDEQVASAEALSSRLKGQASELNELKDLLYLHKVALRAHNQEMLAIKELVKAEQVMRAQALEEMLISVRKSLDEQFYTSQTLHSSVMAQLQNFQLANGPAWPIKPKLNEEGCVTEELVSMTAEDANKLQEKTDGIQVNPAGGCQI